MAEQKQNTIVYRVRNTFPGKAFSKVEQQKIAAQISNQLTLHKSDESLSMNHGVSKSRKKDICR